MLLNAPGHSATVLVALATSGGTPSAMSAGNVSNVPPPAIEFTMPPTAAATATAIRRIGDIVWTLNYRPRICGNTLQGNAGRNQRTERLHQAAPRRRCDRRAPAARDGRARDDRHAVRRAGSAVPPGPALPAGYCGEAVHVR